MLEVPFEEGWSLVPPGSAEVAGSNLVMRANLWHTTHSIHLLLKTCPVLVCNESEMFLCCAHSAVSAGPVQTETGGTGPETGADGRASKPTAGAATAAGCPAETE